MAFMLKVRWDIAPGKADAFRASQQALCTAMLDHPGVITYHAAYPDELVSEWIELYATDAAFLAHLENPAGKAPHAAVIAACTKVTTGCFGTPGPDARAILEGFGASFEDSGSRLLRPQPSRRQRLGVMKADRCKCLRQERPVALYRE